MTMCADYLKRINYRKLAFTKYAPICAVCGFGIRAVLEVCHLDCDRSNNTPSNLAILCPNCHKMHDLGLMPTDAVAMMRDAVKKVDWGKRMKDAGKKAADRRKKNQAAFRRKWRLAGLKAAATRAKNKRISN